MVNLRKIRNLVFRSLFDEYQARGTDFHFKINKVKIEEMGTKRIGRACSMLQDEGLLIRRNTKPSPPIYKTNFDKWKSHNGRNPFVK